MPNDQPLSPEDFAAKIKAKYPEYSSVPDQELTQKIIFKYPEYAQKVRVAPATAGGAPQFNYPIPGQEKLVQGASKVGSMATSALDKMGGQKLGELEKAHPMMGPAARAATGYGMGGAAEDVATGVMNEIVNMGENTRAAMPAAKASQGFQEVHAAAKDLPVNTSQAQKIAQMALKEKDFGGSPPAVITEFLKRTENAAENPVKYWEARKFYSNASRLSDAEAGSTNAVMRRHMARFTRALGPAIENTTEQAGVLDTYKDAMKNYKTAMRLKSTGEFIKKHAAKAAITGAAGAAGYGLYEAAHK